MKNTEKRSFKQDVQSLCWMLKIAFAAAPGYAALLLITSALIALDNVAGNVLLVRYLYEAMQRQASLKEVFAVLGGMAALLALRYGLRAVQEEYVKPRAALRLRQNLQGKLLEKAVGLDLARYDDPQFYTRFLWANEQAQEEGMELMEVLSRLVSYALMFGMYIAFMWTVDMGVLVSAGLFLVGSFLINMRRVKLNYAQEEACRAHKNRASYAERVFYLAEYAKEMRLTNIRIPIFQGFQRAMLRLQEIREEYGKKQAVLDLLYEVVLEGLVLDGGLYAYLSWRMLAVRAISPGELMSLASAAENLVWRMQDMISVLPQLAEKALYIQNLRRFLSTPPQMQDGQEEAPENGDIVFEEVCFRYPGQEKYCLDGLNLHLRAGEKVALAGENGAGKSTLVSLLLRLYDPEKGRILYAGKDIRLYSLSSLRKRFGVLFQNFGAFAATLAGNVAMGEAEEKEKIRLALEMAGLAEKTRDMPLDRQLTREFDPDGVQLSGGETQKLALARLYYRNSSIWLLDEPSAALDPIAEAQLNRALFAGADGRTMLVVCHRLTAARFCDRILFMKNGAIAEDGSHDRLMHLGGEYEKMFAMQAERYCIGQKKVLPEMENLC